MSKDKEVKNQAYKNQRVSSVLHHKDRHSYLQSEAPGYDSQDSLGICIRRGHGGGLASSLQPQLSACPALSPTQPPLQLHITRERVPWGHSSSQPKLILPTHTPRSPVGAHRCHCHPPEECTLESNSRSLGRES